MGKVETRLHQMFSSRMPAKLLESVEDIFLSHKNEKLDCTKHIRYLPLCVDKLSLPC